MNNRELFDQGETLIVLDKPYLVRFTMQAVFELEKQYKSISAALAALCGDDSTQGTKSLYNIIFTIFAFVRIA